MATAFFQFYYRSPDDAALRALLQPRPRSARAQQPDLDARLNRELLAALLPLTRALQAHQGGSARAANTAAFSLASSAMGIAIFHHTRRDKSLHVDATAAFGQLLAWVFRA